MTTAADLSSTYSREASHDPKVHTDIRLFENLLEQDLEKRQWVKDRGSDEWAEQVFKNAAIFEGSDELLWGRFLICIYKDPDTDKISSLILDKLGVTHFNPVDISSKSQFYPAIENLTKKYKDSNVRKCIAVSLLQKYAQLQYAQISRINSSPLKFDYDPTHAGDLAGRCKLIDNPTPEKIGRRMLSMGLLTSRLVKSTLLDVVYERKESITEINNRLVFHLGEQLEQLFNPLAEYSPEQTEYTYKPPDNDRSIDQDSDLVKSIVNELLQLQTKFTLSLVEFLQGFLINLRIKVLNEEIEGLSTVKLNRLFPPTIDEVTRINCIFLDSLKAAIPFGSLEILKACSVTIPYFYKAYTRHEAATKNFTKDLKLFLRNFNDCIPKDEAFSSMKIEALINGPQEKLSKLKLIIDRLYESQQLTSAEEREAKENYHNITQAIDAFGKMKPSLSSYNTRVFTPSGKILTELAKGWPQELQYKWLKRRVVGVYDIINNDGSEERELLVIFSDYIVFLEVINGEQYYAGNNSRPKIADILMNSLINEVPLPVIIPKLKVRQYSYIDDIMVTILDKKLVRFDSYRSPGAFFVTCELSSNSVSASAIADLVIKAKILEKETAFHLFKAEVNESIIYSTAHELESYKNESLKSKFALFLSMEPSQELLVTNKLHVAIFAKFIDNLGNNDVQLDILTSDGRTRAFIVPPEGMVLQIFEELKGEVPICYSSIFSPFLQVLFGINEQLVNEVSRYLHPSETVNNCNEGQLDKFTQDHEKKKSFGTITTFRSYTSDLKDIESNKDTEDKISAPKQNSDRAAEKHSTETKKHFKSNSVSAKASEKQQKQQKKRRSLLKVFKSVFKSRSSKSNSKKEGISNRESLKISKPIVNKKTPETKRETKSLHNLKTSKNDQEKEILNNRITSVIRHTRYGSKEQKQPEINDSYRNEERQSSASSGKINCIVNDTQSAVLERLSTVVSKKGEQKAYEISPSNTENINSNVSDEQSVHLSPHFSIIPTSFISQNLDNDNFEDTKDIIIDNQEFYQGQSRQSQLFNDDLYGELADKEGLKEETSSNGNENHSDYETREDIEKCVINEINESNGDISDLLNGKQSKDSTNDIIFPPELDHEHVIDNSVATSPTKNHIFPKIPVQQPPKILFERSTSFVDLFRGMRLILDENDAQYTWRRLSSETSLSEKLELKTNKPTSHVFKSIARETSRASIPIISEQVEGENHGKQSSPLKKQKDKASFMSLPLEDQNIYHDGEISVKELETINFFDSITSIKKYEKKNIPDFSFSEPPNFKVIKASPTRIVNKISKTKDISHSENNITYDFSISSDLNMDTNKRWVELKLPSQEDLQDDEFYSPTEQYTEKFTNERLEIDDHSSISGCEKEINETSQETSVEDSSKQMDVDALIEDMDFSSFHMTFDNSLLNDDSSRLSPTVKPVNHNDTIENLQILGTKSQQEPLFYRLPRNMAMTSKTISSLKNNNEEGKEAEGSYSIGDEDAIWVSPSKIGFYDLSKSSEFPVSVKREAHSYSSKSSTKKTLQVEHGDCMSLRELSYAYLASFVNSDQESDPIDDGPIRLQFCE